MGLEMTALSLQVISHFITCQTVVMWEVSHLSWRNDPPSYAHFVETEIVWIISCEHQKNIKVENQRQDQTTQLSGLCWRLFGKP